MKKRIVSLLLAALLFVTLLPAEALAYVGNVNKEGPLCNRTEPVTIKREGVDDGSQLYSMKMKNGKLVFFLAVDGPHIGKSVTNSDRGYTATGDSFRKGVYEQARFTLQTTGGQRELPIQKMEVIDPTKDLTLEAVSIHRVISENALTVKYTFANVPAPEFACYISYYFVELDKGTSEGDFEATYVTADGKTYALVAQAFWGLDIPTDYTTTPDFVFRWFQEYHGFSRMGHAQADPSAHVKVSRSYKQKGTYTAKSTDITAGMGRTNVYRAFGSGDVCEVYSDSYGVDSPFVLAHTDTIRHSNDVMPTVYMTYDAENDLLTAECGTERIGGRTGHPPISAIQVWGFRDVYTKKEAASLADVKFTEPDRVTIPQDADRLGLYKSGDKIVAAPITDTARENVLKKKYGDPLYILCGDFEPGRDDNGKYYEYTDRKVGLTSTITATWGSGQHFRVRVDENGFVTRFDTTAQVTYSTPRFLLYSAKNGVTEAAELAFDGEVLALNMKPEDNAVLVFIDIPEVSSRISKALIKGNGCLELSGNMGLDLILNCGSDKLIELKRLGYGPKKEENGSIPFVQQGFEASGKLDTGSLMGLDLAELEADINTFDGEEQYNFSLELNVFDLFETAAELNLKRLNNGRLAPNDLYFRLAVAGGIPIVPPVPTSFIKGGGGGFYGLADTINGDFIAIPPIRVKMSVKGDYVKVIEGWANVTVGPSYLEFAGTDLTIAKMDFIDEFKMYLRLVGEKRTYKSTEYTGLRAGGGMGLTLAAPGKNDPIGTIFELDTEVEASIFGGLDNYSKPTSAYVNLDSRGSLSASVKIPKKLGSLSFGRLGGKKLVNTRVDFILGAETAIPVGKNAGSTAKEVLKNVTTDAWKNLSIYGGISKKGSLVLTGYRIYYIIPNHFGGDIELRWKNDAWTLDKEIEKNNWGWGPGTQSVRAMSAPVWTTQVADCLDAETGEQVGIAVLEVSTYEVAQNGIALLAAQQSNGKYEDTIEYKAENNPPDGKLGMFIAPKAGATVETLKQELGVYNVTDDTNITKIELKEAQEGADGNIPNSELESANMTEVMVDNEDGSTTAGLLINLGANSNAASKWKIEANCDFTYEFLASADLTGVKLDLDAQNKATANITNLQTGKTYAVRFYLDTEQDRTGTNYYLGMVESSPYEWTIPTSGALAPTGNYYVTAVLVEGVKADLNGNGTIEENEFSWVTVDTATSQTTISYTNNSTPNAPSNVTLAATGNETLTASWNAVDGADGYRVALYYLDGNTEKQAGAAYVLENEDFDSSKQPHATKDASGKLSLRMAPTVGGNNVTVGYPNTEATGEVNKEDVTLTRNGTENDITPTETNYYVKVEAFKKETVEGVAGDLRYYSNPATSGQVNLPTYSPPDVGVITDTQYVRLDGSNGYATLLWNALPTGTLFKINSAVDSITITPEQGRGTFTVAGDSPEWTVTCNEAARQLIANSGRVKLTVKRGLDSTDYYLRLALDDVPPLLTLDADNVCADMTTGAYTVAGRTEPGLTVTMGIPNAANSPTATADEAGRFSFTGNLEGNATEGFTAILANVSAKDEAGNETIAPALISARPDLTPPEEDDPTDPTDPADPSNPGGSSSSGGGSYGGGTRPSISAEKTSPDARSTTDYTDGIYGLTFRSSASFASFRGVQVDGKTIAPSNYIAEEGSIVVYLKAVYLQTLKPGKHTVTILSSEGDATMSFTIGGVTTGDAGIMLYAMSAALSLAGTAVVRGRKRRG